MADDKHTVEAEEQTKVWTTANIITLTRIVLIPIFVVLLLAPWPQLCSNPHAAVGAQPWIAAIFFIILSATDSLDGHIARSRNQVTTLGKFLDPIADKILVCAALLALIEIGTLPSWIAIVILSREFIVSAVRMMAASKGVVIAASWIGKWKTAVTMVAIVLFIIKDSPAILSMGGFGTFFNVFAWVVMIAAVILTIVSMVDYFAKAEKDLHLFGSGK